MRSSLVLKVKRRKNFFPTLLVAGGFWLAWGYTVFKIPPESGLVYFGFFSTLFLASFFTCALVFANSRLGFLTACFLILILLFRYFQIGNLLNLSLLIGIYIALVLYLR